MTGRSPADIPRVQVDGVAEIANAIRDFLGELADK
jgi:hypothetical protein